MQALYHDRSPRWEYISDEDKEQIRDKIVNDPIPFTEPFRDAMPYKSKLNKVFFHFIHFTNCNFSIIAEEIIRMLLSHAGKLACLFQHVSLFTYIVYISSMSSTCSNLSIFYLQPLKIDELHEENFTDLRRPIIVNMVL